MSLKTENLKKLKSLMPAVFILFVLFLFTAGCETALYTVLLFLSGAVSAEAGARKHKKLPLKLKNTSPFGIILALFWGLDLLLLIFPVKGFHIPVYLAAVFFSGYFGGKISFGKRGKIFAVIYTAAIFAALCICGGFAAEQPAAAGGAYIIIGDMAVGFAALLWYDKINLGRLFQYIDKKKFCKETEADRVPGGFQSDRELVYGAVRFIIIAFFLALTEISVRSFISSGSFFSNPEPGFEFIKSGVFFLNLLFAYILSELLSGIAGRRISNIILLLVWAVFIIGNFIKLKYHDTLLQAVELVLIKEMFLIGRAYIGSIAYYGILAVLGVLAVLILLKIKKVTAFLKPGFSLVFTVLMLIPFSQMLFLLNTNILSGTDPETAGVNEKLKYEREGALIYSCTTVKALGELYPDKPGNYSREYMAGLKNSFDALSAESPNSGINPDVIVIMAESYFDVKQMKEAVFSEDMAYPCRDYETAGIISPKYGGGTAAVEFEALTGLSNYFLIDNVIAYTTYFKNGVTVPAVPHEFNKNGYETIIMHPNTAEFYNRDNAYKAMGFEKYYSIDDFETENNLLNDGYYKDAAFGKKLTETAADDSRPQFIYGITIEGHSPFMNKYKDEDINIEVSSEILSAESLKELLLFSQSIKNTSGMIDDVIDYVENTERPTLLYVFGDHLPPLSALSKSELLSSPQTKYLTPLITYSNFTDIETGAEYITPNQLAPQVLLDSGIKHSSYFDFIYSLRKNYPVIQREFNIDSDSEDIKKYENVQYDILFGEQYLVNDN